MSMIWRSRRLTEERGCFGMSQFYNRCEENNMRLLAYPRRTHFRSNPGLVDERQHRIVVGAANKAADEFGSRPMSQTEEAHHLIVNEGFPCGPASPRETSGLDVANRQPFRQSGFTLAPRPRS